MNRKPFQITGTERARIIERAQANADYFDCAYTVFFDTSGNVRSERQTMNRCLAPGSVVAHVYPRSKSS